MEVIPEDQRVTRGRTTKMDLNEMYLPGGEYFADVLRDLGSHGVTLPKEHRNIKEYQKWKVNCGGLGGFSRRCGH